MNKREEDFEKSAMDYCEDHSHCIYFEAGAEYGYQYAIQHPQWIPVEERLPEKDGKYIFYDEVLGHEVSIYYDGATLVSSITHWMPLPQAPVKKRGEQ